MSEWTYEIGEVTLEFRDNPQAFSNEPDRTHVLRVIDREIHRLTAIIQKSESDIYKLRKWQRIAT